MLYLTTNGLGEPHVTSQVLPYMERLVPRHSFTLVTHEKPGAPRAEVEAAAQRLEKSGIAWRALTHRKPPLGTVRNVAEGARIAARLAADADAIHARSYIAGSMAMRASRRSGKPWIFDMRGFYIDERIDGGQTRAGSLVERALRREERRLVADADHVVVLTRRAKELLEAGGFGPVRAPITVIPCCVDVDRFRPGAPREGPPALAYSGSLGSFYLEDEMAGFAAALRAALPDLRVRIASRQDTAPFARRLRAAGFPEADVSAERLMPHEVPAFLRDASAGMIFVRTSRAKLASSPIKVGEYLASGLPVAISAGCGDASEMVEQEKVGVCVDPRRPGTFAEAAQRFASLLAEPGVRARCRRLAEREFAVEAGAALYAKVYAALPANA